MEDLVVCPFYKRDRKAEIQCEGFAGQVSTEYFRFSSFEAKKTFMVKFCYTEMGHRQCPLAKTLYKRYDEEWRKEWNL